MEKILNPMFESMDINEDQKVALQESFDKAVLKKTTEMLDEHVETKVQEKVEVLEEEFQEKVSLLEDSLDGYLDTVVEEFVAENAPSYEAQINDEKAQTLLEMFDQMVQVVGVDMLTINEGKLDRDAKEYEETAVRKVDMLESKVADLADRLVDANRDADKYLQAGIIAETTEGLSLLEADKFNKLAEMIPFEKSASYLEKLEVLKETIIDARVDGFELETKTVAGTPGLPGTAFRHPEAVDVKAAQDFSQYI